MSEYSYVESTNGFTKTDFDGNTSTDNELDVKSDSNNAETNKRGQLCNLMLKQIDRFLYFIIPL